VGADTTEEFKQEVLAEEGLNETSFDVVQSPSRRNNTVYVGANQDQNEYATGMVP